MNAASASCPPRISSLFRLQWEEAQGNWVLLYPEGMVRLNGSAGEILCRCDGRRTVAEVVNDLEHRFGAAGLARDVHGFLDLAAERGWVVWS